MNKQTKKLEHGRKFNYAYFPEFINYLHYQYFLAAISAYGYHPCSESDMNIGKDLRKVLDNSPYKNTYKDREKFLVPTAKEFLIKSKSRNNRIGINSSIWIRIIIVNGIWEDDKENIPIVICVPYHWTFFNYFNIFTLNSVMSRNVTIETIDYLKEFKNIQNIIQKEKYINGINMEKAEFYKGSRSNSLKELKSLLGNNPLATADEIRESVIKGNSCERLPEERFGDTSKRGVTEGDISSQKMIFEKNSSTNINSDSAPKFGSSKNIWKKFDKSKFANGMRDQINAVMDTIN